MHIARTDVKEERTLLTTGTALNGAVAPPIVISGLMVTRVPHGLAADRYGHYDQPYARWKQTVNYVDNGSL